MEQPPERSTAWHVGSGARMSLLASTVAVERDGVTVDDEAGHGEVGVVQSWVLAGNIESLQPTMASSHQQIIERLREATLESAKLPEAINAFQTMVWHSEEWESHYSNNAVEVLRDLAYDLDFYVPDAQMRTEDPSYYGADWAIEEISTALRQIEGA